MTATQITIYVFLDWVADGDAIFVYTSPVVPRIGETVVNTDDQLKDHRYTVIDVEHIVEFSDVDEDITKKVFTIAALTVKAKA